MGNTTKEQLHIESQLMFVANTENQFFGPHEIFKMNAQPHDYILKLERVFFASQDRAKQEYNILSDIMNSHHKAIARVHHLNLQEENHMCSKHNYYNFSLRTAIRRKRQLGQTFKEAEIWYVFKTLLELSLQLEQRSIYFGNYSLDSIFISPEGLIKVFAHELMPENKHLNFFKAQQGKPTVLPPQAIESLHRKVTKPNYDIGKADLFGLAICGLSLVYMEEEDRVYHQGEILEDEILKHVQMISNRLSDRLQIFLNYALEIDPVRRINFTQALNFIHNIQEKGQEVSNLLRLKVEETERGKRESLDGKRVEGSRAVKIKMVKIPQVSGSSYREGRASQFSRISIK